MLAVDTPVAALTETAATPSDSSAGPVGGLRLRLRERRQLGEFLDGGWWPHSDDLSAELPALLEKMFADGYDIHRITYHLTRWAPAPRHLNVPGHQVRLGGYRTDDAALLSLVDSTGWGRVDLVVVPPATASDVAERALLLAGSNGDRHRASALLEAAAAAASAG